MTRTTDDGQERKESELLYKVEWERDTVQLLGIVIIRLLTKGSNLLSSIFLVDLRYNAISRSKYREGAGNQGCERSWG
jgi:hypothetical protein